jgi:hypothetical protein
MAKTTGPILAIGAITMVNNNILHKEPVDLRVPIATGVVAGAFALFEKGWEKGAVFLSYLALLTILLTRTNPNVPSPTESFVDWWNEKR